MIRSILRIALAATALVAAQVHAAAHATQVTFSGVVTDASSDGLAGPAAGETFTASVTLFSMPGYVQSFTDGSTYSNLYGSTSNPDAPLLVGGGVTFSGGKTLSFSTTPLRQFVYLDVDRGDADGLDFLGFEAETLVPGSADSLDFVFTILQAPNASTRRFLFSDPNGGLSFYQPLDLAADGVFAIGSFVDATGHGSFGGGFTVTAIAVKDVSAVPEPSGGMLMLAGAGLLGATLRRRRQP